MSTIETTTRKARKRHQCHGCGGGIEAGAFYIRDIGTWEGEFSSLAWHPVCYGRAQDIAAQDGCWEGGVGFLNEWHEPPASWFTK